MKKAVAKALKGAQTNRAHAYATADLPEGPQPPLDMAAFISEGANHAGLKKALGNLATCKTLLTTAIEDPERGGKLLAALRYNQAEVDALLGLPPTDLLLEPYIADKAGRLAANLASLLKSLTTINLNALDNKTLGRFDVRLKSCGIYLASYRAMFTMAPYQLVAVAIHCLSAEAHSRAGRRCQLALAAAGKSCNGNNTYTRDGFKLEPAAATPADPSPESAAAAAAATALMARHKHHVHCHVLRLQQRAHSTGTNIEEVKKLVRLLDAADPGAACYGHKFHAGMCHPGFGELFTLMLTSLPLALLRDLELYYVPAVGLTMACVVQPAASICDQPFNLSSPLVESYAACPGFVLRLYSEQAAMVKYILGLDWRKLPPEACANVMAHVREMRQRFKAMDDCGGVLNLVNDALRHEQGQLQTAFEATATRTLAIELHGNTASSLALILQQLAALNMAMTDVRKQVAAGGKAAAGAAGEAKSEEEPPATDVWEMFDQVEQLGPAAAGEVAGSPKTAAAEGSAAGEPAGSPKAAAAAPKAQDSAAEEAAAEPDEAPAAAAATPAGFKSWGLNPLFGRIATAKPAAPPHGLKYLDWAAGNKEQRAAN